jgi:hypothetical protein
MSLPRGEPRQGVAIFGAIHDGYHLWCRHRARSMSPSGKSLVSDPRNPRLSRPCAIPHRGDAARTRIATLHAEQTVYANCRRVSSAANRTRWDGLPPEARHAPAPCGRSVIEHGPPRPSRASLQDRSAGHEARPILVCSTLCVPVLVGCLSHQLEGLSRLLHFGGILSLSDRG